MASAQQPGEALGLLPVEGIRLGTACAGIRRSDRDDLAIIEMARGSSCAALFTRNRFCAAPVAIAREHLSKAEPRFLLINSGNANAGTGEEGRRAALSTCRALAARAGCALESVLPFSTGVIGEPLPANRINAAIPAAYVALSAEGWPAAARAIMTTDTLPKGYSTEIDVLGQRVTLTGIAKGAGMIQPDMATMLAFLATDAALDPSALDRCLRRAVESSFNRITVDGDTSTNDACVLIATGRAKLAHIDASSSPAFGLIETAVGQICTRLAQSIVRDGEGATKFIGVEVSGGGTRTECLQVARAVANSPLVKTAFFACDPNWGRILAAVGKAGIADLDVAAVSIDLDEVCIVRGGARAGEYTEEQGRRVMQRPEITLHIDLGRGPAHETVWTCDFSYDYVRINAGYRS